MDFDQFETERLDLGEYAIEGGLVGEHTGQDGLVAPRPGLESGKRGADRLAKVAADADFITLRPWIDDGPPGCAGYSLRASALAG